MVMVQARQLLLIDSEQQRLTKMRRFFDTQCQNGTTLVEVLVAIALTGIMLPALATAIISSNDARPTATQQLLADGLLQQIMTATRNVRDQSWTNIVTDGTY